MATETKRRSRPDTAESEIVTRSQVARFLRCDVAEVQRMIEMDDLPFMEKPDPAKPGVRIFLPDFHTWSIAKASHNSTKLRNYAEFSRAFFAAQQPQPKTPLDPRPCKDV